jgi:hypothetical protein
MDRPSASSTYHPMTAAGIRDVLNSVTHCAGYSHVYMFLDTFTAPSLIE